MTTPAPKSQVGGMANFNIQHGFPEALVRGMRSSFLADPDSPDATDKANWDYVSWTATTRENALGGGFRRKCDFTRVRKRVGTHFRTAERRFS